MFHILYGKIKLYVHNFIERGINPNQIHVVLGLVQGKQEPSKESEELKNLNVNVHYFVDDRVKKHYIPSIKPFLISKWIQSNPEFGKLFSYMMR
jgi:NAD(P)H-flavin reductase